MLNGGQNWMMGGAALVAMALTIGVPQAEPAQQAASGRIATAFNLLPKSDRLAVEAAGAMTKAEAEACKGRASAQLGRVCTAHVLMQATLAGRVHYVTVDSREGSATTVLKKVPVAH